MIKKCEVCGSAKLKKVLDLGNHPLCDDLIPIGSKKKNKLYRIEVLFCKICFTGHQRYQVKKKFYSIEITIIGHDLPKMY